MSIDTQSRQGRAPELALRLRMSAAIFTRAACLLASGQTLQIWRRTEGTWYPSRADGLTLRGLIQHARADLHREARTNVPDGEPDEGAVHFAFALIAQDPINMNPPLGRLIKAAHKLREWAAFEESLMQWATADIASERKPAHYVPFHRNGAWIFTMPYGISNVYPTEAEAKHFAKLTLEQDELARETTATIRRSRETRAETASVEVAA